MNPDDLTVAARSREAAMVGTMRGEAWWHDGIGGPRGKGATVVDIARYSEFPDGWYKCSSIRPGQLVEWTRGEAWGVSPYKHEAREPTYNQNGHIVEMDDEKSGRFMQELWVETASPAPRVDYREQVRLAREVLGVIAADGFARGAYATEALRLMDGGTL